MAAMNLALTPELCTKLAYDLTGKTILNIQKIRKKPKQTTIFRYEA